MRSLHQIQDDVFIAIISALKRSFVNSLGYLKELFLNYTLVKNRKKYEHLYYYFLCSDERAALVESGKINLL